MRFRILPLVILVAFIMVVVKASDVVMEKLQGAGNSVISKYQAVAEEEAEAGEDETEENAEEEGATLSPNYSGSGPAELEITNMTEMERNLLENLAKRREKLEEWSESISMKENILNATEKKINRKMAELKKLQKNVSTLLEQYNSKERKKVQRLVKIYESMKAQSAASIFSEMEMGVLLEVLNNMKEAKAAKILAKMESIKAKEITMRLADQGRLPSK